MPTDVRSTSKAWLVPLVYAFAVGVIALFVHRLPLFGPETDFLLFYQADAERVLAGDLPTDPYRGPGYPVILAIAMATTRLPAFEAGVLLSVLSSTLALVITIDLACRIAGSRIAAWSGFFMVSAWAFARYGYAASSDALFLLMTIAIIRAAHAETLGIFRLLAIGVGCGVAMLTRFNAFFLVPGLLLGLAWRHRQEPWRAFVRSWLVAAAPLVIGTLVALIPWGIHTARLYGRPFHNRNHENLAFALHGGGDTGWDAFWYSMPDAPGPHVHMFETLWDVIAYDPMAVMLKWLSGLALNPALDAWELLGLPVALTALVGFVRPDALRSLKLGMGAWGSVSLIFWLVMAIAFYSPRLFLPLLPFYAFVLAQLAVPLYDASQARWRHGVWVARVHAFVCIFAVVTVNVVELSHTPWSLDAFARQAMEEHGLRGEEVVVMARKPHFAYFVGAKHLQIPNTDDHEAFVEAVCKSDVTHVLFTDRERRTRPALDGVERSGAGRDVFVVAVRGRDDERDVLLEVRRGACPGAVGGGANAPER